MAYIKNNWVDREGQTRYHETIDDDGALIFTPDYEKVTELGTPVNADNMNHIEDGIVDHENRITVLEEAGDASNFLNKSQITNCLLEVPQNIKLELNNGTLTLKAGSKVIVPNGVGVFDEVTITSDISFPYLDLGSRTALVSIRPSASAMQVTPIQNIASGTSTTSSGLYYNTSENKIYRNGVFDGESLPIAKVTYVNGSGVVSIDETFHDIGYFGSTIFANKDIKGLIPNGRNADGTLNNMELNSPAVRTVNVGKNQTNFSLVLNNEGLYILGPFNYVASGATPLATGVCYVEATNKLYNNGGQRWWVYIASFSTDANGRIIALKTKLPFKAIDYNDKSLISGWGLPSNKSISLTVGETQSTVTAPTNGWFTFQGTTKSTSDAFIWLGNTQTGLSSQGTIKGIASLNLHCFLPVRRNDTVGYAYNNVDSLFLNFVYLEGDQ